MRSLDGGARVSVEAWLAMGWPADSGFTSLCEEGAVGHSMSHEEGTLDCLRLHTFNRCGQSGIGYGT